MEIHIKVHGQSEVVDVSVEVYEYLDRSDHKTENLFHEQRRHWDGREFDEYIVAHESSRSYYETPKDLLCQKGNPSGNYSSLGKLHGKTALPLFAFRSRGAQLFPDWYHLRLFKVSYSKKYRSGQGKSKIRFAIRVIGNVFSG